jgi:hypothetical protein
VVTTLLADEEDFGGAKEKEMGEAVAEVVTVAAAKLNDGFVVGWAGTLTDGLAVDFAATTVVEAVVAPYPNVGVVLTLVMFRLGVVTVVAATSLTFAVDIVDKPKLKVVVVLGMMDAVGLLSKISFFPWLPSAFVPQHAQLFVSALLRT